MVDHWEAFGPPVYIPVASYFGLGRKSSKSDASGSKEDNEGYGNLNDLVSMFSDSGGLIG